MRGPRGSTAPGGHRGGTRQLGLGTAARTASGGVGWLIMGQKDRGKTARHSLIQAPPSFFHTPRQTSQGSSSHFPKQKILQNPQSPQVGRDTPRATKETCIRAGTVPSQPPIPSTVGEGPQTVPTGRVSAHGCPRACHSQREYWCQWGKDGMWGTGVGRGSASPAAGGHHRGVLAGATG